MQGWGKGMADALLAYIIVLCIVTGFISVALWELCRWLYHHIDFSFNWV